MSKQSSRGTAWNRTRRFVLERDGWLCQACGKALEGRDATVDHVIPVDAGGSDDPSNLVAMCRKDNGTKSNKLIQRITWFNRDFISAA